jgi:hypothetical protein
VPVDPRASQSEPWRPKLAPGWLAWLVTVLVLFVLVGPWAHVPCAAAAPCRPSPLTFAGFGLLVSLVAAVYAHHWAARLLVAGTLGLVLAGAVQEAAYAGWGYAVAVVVALVGWWFTLRRRSAGVTTLPVLGHAAVPRPTRLSYYRPSTAVWAAVLAIVAVLIGLGALAAQEDAEARAASARLVSGEVVRHLDDGVEVRLDDGSMANIRVDAPADYPVGSRFPLRVDDAGLAEPVSEPYDTSGWIGLAALAGGAALAVGWRSAATNLARRRLYNTPQPVRQVQVLRSFDELLVRSPAGRKDALAIPMPPMSPERTVRAAKLYGQPATGSWCAVELNGEMLYPDCPAVVKNWLEPGSREWNDLLAALARTYREHASLLEEHISEGRRLLANLPPDERSELAEQTRREEQTLAEMRKLLDPDTGPGSG